MSAPIIDPTITADVYIAALHEDRFVDAQDMTFRMTPEAKLEVVRRHPNMVGSFSRLTVTPDMVIAALEGGALNFVAPYNLCRTPVVRFTPAMRRDIFWAYPVVGVAIEAALNQARA